MTQFTLTKHANGDVRDICLNGVPILQLATSQLNNLTAQWIVDNLNGEAYGDISLFKLLGIQHHD